MGKKVFWAICTMTVCALGILALQLFYSVRNYEYEKRSFSKSANEAFKVAADSAFSMRTNQVVAEFRKWVSDTDFVRITSKVNPAYGTTVFTMAEVDPSPKGQTRISLSLEDFRRKVQPITSEARRFFIDHLVKMAKTDLKNRYVYFYTQKLGDSLEKAMFSSPLDTILLRKAFSSELQRRDIGIGFSLDPKKIQSGAFVTQAQNLEPKTNKPPRWVKASFANSGLFVLGQIKWAILGSVFLLLLTVVCFGYVLRVLLSQEKLSAMKDGFIRNMTHELHTPIASLAVTAESLKRFSHDEENRQAYIEIILLQTRRLGLLVSEILSAAKMGVSGKKETQVVNLHTLVLEVKSFFGPNEVTYEGPNGDFALIGNSDDLRKMLFNLVDNGLKYNANPSPAVNINLSGHAKNITMKVSDNGIGIPDSEKKRVFEPFYRIAQGDRHDVKGYGLGLYMVKEIVLRHNGRVEFGTNPEGETCVNITFRK